MIKKKLALGLSLLLLSGGALQAQKIERVEPLFWWTEMKQSQFQIMVYGESISELRPQIDYEGVTLEKSIVVENPNYMFLYLNIDPETEAGTFPIKFMRKNKRVLSVDYTLHAREEGSAMREGYNGTDAIYLITPDRFANGDPGNDSIAGMADKLDRPNKESGRHGGDIAGIVKNIDYIDDMGFTAVWLNPLLENDQPDYSYHGYATTDFYKVDSRFGTNEEYRNLCVEAKSKGIKIIMDMILNHCGSSHWWMSDLPTKDWINQVSTEFVETSHARTTLRDPYASDIDKLVFSDGWFVPTMPDMNQRNPLLADYLIQNTLWWIEYLGISGIRMDTYPYSNKEFMSEWTRRVAEEYPNFKIVGEEWTLNPAILAYWQKGKHNADGYRSYLSGLLDFPLQSALVRALTEPEAWEAGMPYIYLTLSDDFQYPSPADHVIFPDNHDMSRIYTQLGEDDDLFKIAMSFFLTTRGVPQIYYGTEILMSNLGDDSHGNIRSDFPGGWDGDSVNAFTGKGLSPQQREAQEYVKRILNWRKGSEAIHDGELKHFYPSNSVYVYFRYTDEQKVMVVLNKSDEQQSMKTSRFAEILSAGESGVDIISGKKIVISDEFVVAPKSSLIVEF